MERRLNFSLGSSTSSRHYCLLVRRAATDSRLRFVALIPCPHQVVLFDRCNAHPNLTLITGIHCLNSVPPCCVRHRPIRCFAALFSLNARSCCWSSVVRIYLHSLHRSGLHPVTNSAMYLTLYR